jgi:hypothetical protein
MSAEPLETAETRLEARERRMPRNTNEFLSTNEFLKLYLEKQTPLLALKWTPLALFLLLAAALSEHGSASFGVHVLAGLGVDAVPGMMVSLCCRRGC